MGSVGRGTDGGDVAVGGHAARRWRTVGLVVVTALVVSPLSAAATHRFRDVQDGSAHAEAIAWLVESGVTAGCADGETYCPEDAVSREQMATFMRRLAGAAPGVAPSVDAATVQGLGPADLRGAPGPPGADGRDGADGADGTDGVAGLLLRSTTGTAGANAGFTATVSCPFGWRAVGGGYHASQRDVQIPRNGPNTALDSWTVQVRNVGTVTLSADVYAICATVATP
jgi:hypothetical protein